MIRLLITNSPLIPSNNFVYFSSGNKYYIQLETENGTLKEDITNKISPTLEVTMETNGTCVANFSIGSQEFKNIETYFRYNER